MKTQTVLKLAAFSGLLSFSTISWAACSGGYYGYTATMPVKTLTAPRDQAIGTPIGAEMSLPAGTGRTVSCTGSAAVYSYLKFGINLTPSDIPGVYKTNVEGIGIKIWNNFVNTFTLSNNLQQWYQLSNGGSHWLTGIRAQYYIIGPVSPGNVSPYIVIDAWANNYASTTGGLLYNRLTIGGSTAVTVSACETPNVEVKLSKHDAQNFPGIGSTSGASNFTFRINKCGTGLASVSYTFKPTSGATVSGSGASQYLTLSSDSTASGVGIQVLYDGGTQNNQLVPLNAKTRFTGYNRATGGDYTIPMKARYIRTGNIVGGTANSALEIAMAYE